ncbi:hypothetical protein PanNE5_37320 [Pandoraea sp. NE5]|nr:hypothetical protein PanNE5_37320 [Pandoraea sp. NE5]
MRHEGVTITNVLIGVAQWGLHMGFTQGILAGVVAETAPKTLRGSAFCVIQSRERICMLLASVIAGWLWDHHGASETFFAGAALAVIPLVMCLLAPRLAKRNH